MRFTLTMVSATRECFRYRKDFTGRYPPHIEEIVVAERLGLAFVSMKSSFNTHVEAFKLPAWTPAEEFNPLFSALQGQPVLSLSLSASEDRLAVGLPTDVAVFDLRRQQLLSRFTTVFTSGKDGCCITKVRLGDDGEKVAVASGNWGQASSHLIIYNVANGALIAKDESASNHVFGLSWGHGRDLIAYATGSDTRMWDWKKSREIRVAGRGTSVSFSPDGARLAVCADNALTVFNLVTFEPSHEPVHSD